jgi:hypothetical protein
VTVRPPAVQPTTPPWRVFVAFAVVLVLALALIVVSRSDAETNAGPAAPPPPVTSTTTQAPSTTLDRDALLLGQTQDALDAWGEFAATGDVDAVREMFLAGPQLDQLQTEAGDAGATWPGLPAFQFALTDTTISRMTEDAAVVRASIAMSRPGTTTTAFRWDIEMRWDDTSERWRLYTVSTPEG